MMQVIPAIDIKDGHCVRLKQGIMDNVYYYCADPVSIAYSWVEAGARRLHLVDLNGAITGETRNSAVINAIANAFPDVQIQIGGGIRNRDTLARYLYACVDYVIIGTLAVKQTLLCNQCKRIIVSIDARDGVVATDGWANSYKVSVIDLARARGAIIYTDIASDGMMDGVNVKASAELARESGKPVIAAGGVTNMQDILASNENSGVLIGRALYEGSLDFLEAQEMCDVIGDG